MKAWWAHYWLAEQEFPETVRITMLRPSIPISYADSQDGKNMTVIDDIEGLVKEVQAEFDKGLANPDYVNSEKYRAIVESALLHSQELYNAVEMALGLLGKHPGEKADFFQDLARDVMGNFGEYKPYYEAGLKYYTYGDDRWGYTRKFVPVSGIRVVIRFLSDALGYDTNSSDFAVRTVSASDSFGLVRGAIVRMGSRLKWLVMYPDSLAKNSQQIESALVKHSFGRVWAEFSAGILNFREGHLLDSTNRFANSIVQLTDGIAANFGFASGGFGTKTLFLERIGLIHSYVREMATAFYGYLSKFRKGQEPSYEEARFLLDLAFSIHGHLLEQLDSIKPDAETVRRASADTKEVTKQTQKKRKAHQDMRHAAEHES